MHILVAPDSFKESLTAREAAEAIARGIADADGSVTVDLCPMSDGGEGMVEAMMGAMGGEVVGARVMGPLGDEVTAWWGWEGREGMAVIEMASAAGLELVAPGRRDVMRSSTYGVGQLIGEALGRGAARIVMGIGGSATTDGGTGMAQALGAKFYDAAGELMTSPMSGGDLGRIARIDLAGLDDRLKGVRIQVACDVVNGLYGADGASRVYGPQKGATAAQVEELDAGLRHLAHFFEGADAEAAGAGAAGGLGFGLMAFTGAELNRGIELVMEAVGFEARLGVADLVITGEGKLDGQSMNGKTCIGIGEAGKRRGIPVIALVGITGLGVERARGMGITAYHSLVGEGVTVERAMREAGACLRALTARVMRDAGGGFAGKSVGR